MLQVFAALVQLCILARDKHPEKRVCRLPSKVRYIYIKATSFCSFTCCYSLTAIRFLAVTENGQS